ncbi:MAG: alpha/beta fold hydrolase [Rhodospirillaceae bacterium]|jgi:pimeloyl-ACP methyl ester carboxylesterase|nr:alpha/beta fold hydrolase [Rhodospirillaceae bacterium]
MTADVDRAFVRIDEGLVHYRHAGARDDSAALPIYVAHAGPGSSAGYAPLIAELGEARFVIAPDTLGNGDSAAPAPEVPDLEYYADSICRILDALDIDKVDYFGSHTGAHIGCELAIVRPDRVRKMIFDGIGIFDTALREEMLANYAPEMAPDEFGTQFTWAWHFLRDQMIHFPYFKRDPEHRILTEMPPPEALHGMVTEVLKAVTTYHHGYRAVFRHEADKRLPLVKIPSLFMAAEPDPLTAFLDDVSGLVPGSEQRLITLEDGLSVRVGAILAFFAP